MEIKVLLSLKLGADGAFGAYAFGGALGGAPGTPFSCGAFGGGTLGNGADGPLGYGNAAFPFWFGSGGIVIGMDGGNIGEASPI